MNNPDIIQSLKKKAHQQIPNKAFLIVAAAALVVAAASFGSFLHQNNKASPAVKTTGAGIFASQDFTKEMGKLRLGMSRQKVINLLGPASWVILSTDRGKYTLSDDTLAFELQWENKDCRNASVAFSKVTQGAVGWDDGSGYCESSPPPSFDRFSCNKPDRQALCH